MLGCVSGQLGTGKTTYLALLAKMTHEQTPVYSNFPINLKNVKIIDIEDLEAVERGLILIDEAYTWLESRTSASSMNIYVSKIIFQSRKRWLDVFISSQLRSAIDLRFKDLEDVGVYARYRPTDTSPFRFIFTGWGKIRKLTLPYEKAKPLFPLFNSWKYPNTKLSKFEPKRYNKEVSKLANEITRKFKTAHKLSRSIVNDILLEKGITDPILIDGTYARLKRKSLELGQSNG